MDAKSMEYVVFDVETTGLSPVDGDRIVEIGAIKIKNGVTVDKFESLVNPERDIPYGAISVHNITEEMVAQEPTADEVLPKMIDFIGGACVVGHNVKFDLNFLCFQLAKCGRKLKDETPSVDTLKLAKGLLPHLTSYKLSYLATSLGIQVQETHRALADVELTGQVFMRLLSIADDHQVESFQQLVDSFGVEKPNFKIDQLTQETLF